MIYLDYNIFTQATKDSEFRKTLLSLVKSEKYIFPFTHVHIAEVNRISGERRQEEIKVHLSTIKEITNSNYLDYRENIGSFTIRHRDPYEVFETINEVPESYLDEIAKLATDLHLKPQIPGLFENCYRMADQYKFFVEMFRSEFPNLGREINNMSKNEARRYLETEVFKMSFEQAFDLLEKSQKGGDLNTKDLTLDFFIENTLYLAGFKTPNKDLKKPSGLLSDHQHLGFASCCPIIVSNDENFRRKALESTDARLVVDSTRGVNFLLVHSGLVNLVSEQNGESLNSKYLDACLSTSKSRK